MRYPKIKEQRKSAPILKIVRADLAILSRSQFMAAYQCSSDDYLKYIQQFGIGELIDFLTHILSEISEGSIRVSPPDMLPTVVRMYELRILELNLLSLELQGLPVINKIALA